MLKFDMVPETASRRISYRLATSTLLPSITSSAPTFLSAISLTASYTEAAGPRA